MNSILSGVWGDELLDRLRRDGLDDPLHAVTLRVGRASRSDKLHLDGCPLIDGPTQAVKLLDVAGRVMDIDDCASCPPVWDHPGFSYLLRADDIYDSLDDLAGCRPRSWRELARRISLGLLTELPCLERQGEGAELALLSRRVVDLSWQLVQSARRRLDPELAHRALAVHLMSVACTPAAAREFYGWARHMSGTVGHEVGDRQPHPEFDAQLDAHMAAADRTETLVAFHGLHQPTNGQARDVVSTAVAVGWFARTGPVLWVRLPAVSAHGLAAATPGERSVAVLREAADAPLELTRTFAALWDPAGEGPLADAAQAWAAACALSP